MEFIDIGNRANSGATSNRLDHQGRTPITICMTKKLMMCLVPLVMLAGCGEPEKIDDDAPAAPPVRERLGSPDDTPPARPVRIGEGGARFDACQATGRIIGVGSGSLPVHNAPYDRAEQIASLAQSAQVFICTRSIDQQWLGVVVPSEDESVDCGVSSPVRSKRNYDGPCQSGWVEGTFVKLIAG